MCQSLNNPIKQSLAIAFLFSTAITFAQVSFVDGIVPLDGVVIAKPNSTSSSNSVDRPQSTQYQKSINWPNSAIRFVVPFAAGGQVDVIARTISTKLSQTIGQPVIIENKPGGGGLIGSASVAKSQPDGYTFLFTSSVHAFIPSLHSKLPYDAEKDFRPVMLIGTSPVIFVTYAEAPYKSLPDLVLSAKQKPTNINFGSAGVGTISHLNMEAFSHSQKIKLNHIPYKGEAPMMVDLLARQIDLVVTSAISSMPHIKNGKLRPLAVSGNKRLALLPEVPTLVEIGLGDMQKSQWLAIFAPVNTPQPIVLQLNEALEKSLSDSSVRQQLSESWSVEVVGSSPEVLQKWNFAEMSRWGKVIRENKINLE